MTPPLCHPPVPFSTTKPPPPVCVCVPVLQQQAPFSCGIHLHLRQRNANRSTSATEQPKKTTIDILSHAHVDKAKDNKKVSHPSFCGPQSQPASQRTNQPTSPVLSPEFEVWCFLLLRLKEAKKCTPDPDILFSVYKARHHSFSPSSPSPQMNTHDTRKQRGHR